MNEPWFTKQLAQSRQNLKALRDWWKANAVRRKPPLTPLQRAILAALAPSAVRLILTPYSNARAASPAELARHLPPGDSRVELAASPREALVMALAGRRTPIICVAGSLFLIGEMLAQLPEKQQDFLAAFGPADSMRDHAPRPSQS